MLAVFCTVDCKPRAHRCLQLLFLRCSFPRVLLAILARRSVPWDQVPLPLPWHYKLVAASFCPFLFLLVFSFCGSNVGKRPGGGHLHNIHSCHLRVTHPNLYLMSTRPQPCPADGRRGWGQLGLGLLHRPLNSALLHHILLNIAASKLRWRVFYMRGLAKMKSGVFFTLAAPLCLASCKLENCSRHTNRLLFLPPPPSSPPSFFFCHCLYKFIVNYGVYDFPGSPIAEKCICT